VHGVPVNTRLRQDNHIPEVELWRDSQESNTEYLGSEERNRMNERFDVAIRLPQRATR